jgi:hypothetical protein
MTSLKLVVCCLARLCCNRIVVLRVISAGGYGRYLISSEPADFVSVDEEPMEKGSRRFQKRKIVSDNT